MLERGKNRYIDSKNTSCHVHYQSSCWTSALNPSSSQGVYKGLKAFADVTKEDVQQALCTDNGHGHGTHSTLERVISR